MTIGMNQTEKNPEFVRTFKLSEKTADVFDTILNTMREPIVPEGDLELEALRRLSLYLGKMFHETYLAANILAFTNMPRAQNILIRQLFESFVRNRYFCEHKIKALNDLRLIPKKTFEETRCNPDAFDQAFLDECEKNYEVWALSHSDLDKIRRPLDYPETIMGMVRSAVSEPGDNFLYYVAMNGLLRSNCIR